MSGTWKIIVIALSVMLLGFSAFSLSEDKADESVLPEAYYQYYQTESALEDRYTRMGGCEVTSETIPYDHEAIRTIRVFYPAELKANDRRYPMILVVNGSNTPAGVYLPFFERLASWGFIVVGNDDPQTGSGETASLTLDYMLNQSAIRDRIDVTNLGLVGYSQGGAGALNLVTRHENGKLFKTVFTGSAAYPLLAESMGWGYDPENIAIPYFMTAATGESDDRNVADINAEFAGVAPLQSLMEIYDAMPDDVLKVRGRCVGAEHTDMILRTDGYMTAWMLYHLQGDEEAGKAFLGENAEIMYNTNWQDVKVGK